MCTLPFWYQPWSTFFVSRLLRAIFGEFLIALSVLDDWGPTVFVNFDFRSLDGFDAFARNIGVRTVFNTGTAVNLNDNARNQFLYTLHLPWLVGFLVKLPTLTAAPITQFPKSRARLTVTLHQPLVDNGFLQVGTFFGRICPRRFTTHTPSDGLLCSTPTWFAATCKTNHFPWEFPLFSTRRRCRCRVALWICCFELVIQREIIFGRWKIVNLRSFFGCREWCRQKIFIFDARINLLGKNLREMNKNLTLMVSRQHHWHVYHQMYRFKKRSGTFHPFRNSIASLVVMCLLEIFIKAVIINSCAGNFIWSTRWNGVISVDNVFTISRLQGWNIYEFD